MDHANHILRRSKYDGSNWEEVYPRNIQVRIKLGSLLQKLGRCSESMAEWQEVLKIDANNLIAREAILQISERSNEKRVDGGTDFEGTAEK
jgi:hypothetical protein